MSGIIRTALIDRYGIPLFVPSIPFSEERWNDGNAKSQCVLFSGLQWTDELEKTYASLKPIYGENVGGFLVGIPSSLKMATLAGPNVYGLYRIAELWSHQAVITARSIEPNFVVFMDAANVWFYGVLLGDLYVFDSSTGELDRLGPIDLAFDGVLTEWENAAHD